MKYSRKIEAHINHVAKDVLLGKFQSDGGKQKDLDKAILSIEIEAWRVNHKEEVKEIVGRYIALVNSQYRTMLNLRRLSNAEQRGASVCVREENKDLERIS